MSDVPARLAAALADRYAIARVLGRGGMATVYLAEDLKHQRPVAVKVLRPELAAVIGADRFLSEIRTTAKLQHANVLPLFDSGEADSFLFYVMPYIAGESLRQRLDREIQLPVPDAVRVATEIAAGLAYAHRQGVIHRDIKPENILLHEGSALIADFGIALAASKVGGSRMTETGMSLGTPHYMSPEQAMGEREITAASDVYALGAVTYEMLTGEPPFSGPTAQAIVAKVVTSQPLAPRVTRSAVPQGVNDAVLIALAKLPADRFASPSQFAEALREGAAPRIAPAPSASGGRMRWVLAGAAALALVAVLFAARGRFVSQPLAVTATRPFTTEEGLFLDPSLSPDGKLLAYAAGPASRMQLFVRSLDGGRAIALTDSNAPRARWPRWSPDGRRIAYIVSGQGIQVVPALGGESRVLIEAGQGRQQASNPAWSPDGRRLAYVSGSRIYARDLSTGRDTLVADVGRGSGFGNVFQLAWSPDGRWLAAATGNFRFAFGGSDLGSLGPARLVVISVETGRIVPVTSDLFATAMELSPVWTADGRHLLFVSTREGGRDVYEVALSSSMEPRGEPTRLTTGINAHSISLGVNDSTLVYSTYQPASNIWAIPITSGAEVLAASGREITRSTELIEEVSASADGSSLVFTSNRAGNADLFRMPSGGGAATQLTSDSTSESGPVWSPDGREIAFRTQRGVNRFVMVMPAGGGRADTVRATRGPRPLRGEDWSPDGRELVLSGSSPRAPLVRVARTATGWGAPREIAGSEDGFNPRWSPDGRLIAFIALTNPGQPPGPNNPPVLAVISPEGGAATIVARADTPTGMPHPNQALWSRDSRTIYFMATGTNGLSAIWGVSPSGGVPRRLVQFGDPDLQPGGNGRFGVDARSFYVRLIRHTGAIGVAGLVRR